MDKIIDIDELAAFCQKLSTLHKTIVLAGGCFDILHEGHIAFLEASKAKGDILCVLLESDARIRQLKGKGRPINNCKTRSQILASLSCVDYIILLPDEMTNALYDQLILSLKPAIITSTKGDPYLKHKERQAKFVGGEVTIVIDRLPHLSTTKLLNQI